MRYDHTAVTDDSVAEMEQAGRQSRAVPEALGPQIPVQAANGSYKVILKQYTLKR